MIFNCGFSTTNTTQLCSNKYNSIAQQQIQFNCAATNTIQSVILKGPFGNDIQLRSNKYNLIVQQQVKFNCSATNMIKLRCNKYNLLALQQIQFKVFSLCPSPPSNPPQQA